MVVFEDAEKDIRIDAVDPLEIGPDDDGYVFDMLSAGKTTRLDFRIKTRKNEAINKLPTSALLSIINYRISRPTWR